VAAAEEALPVAVAVAVAEAAFSRYPYFSKLKGCKLEGLKAFISAYSPPNHIEMESHWIFLNTKRATFLKSTVFLCYKV
jgi:hypothetical protein